MALTLLAPVALVAALGIAPGGQQPANDAEALRVALVKMPYSGSRNVAEISNVPDYLERGGIADRLRSLGARLEPTTEVQLTSEDEKEYGAWHRMGLANGHLAEVVADHLQRGNLPVLLLANCTSVLGALGGLQNATSEPQRVGLVFIDAHGDFNIPETTLSGMLGGMPVAVSAGLALDRLRVESGLDPPLPTEHIVLGAVRDLDPLELELLEASSVERFSTDDIRSVSQRIHAQMRRLSAATDAIYVHVDMDVLDPDEVAGHPLTVANGPTSRELARALAAMLEYDKVVAFGVASTPANERDPDGKSLRAAYRLIEAAVTGVKRR